LSGSHAILPKGGWLVRSGSIRMTIGDPIETAGFTMEDRDEVIFLVREAIRKYLTVREGGVLEAESTDTEVRSAAS
jgi:1-acyl-sn-glycerol-3-phosphate acyltransferase